MPKALTAMIAASGLAAAGVCTPVAGSDSWHWERLPSLPDRLGVAGAFAGVSECHLLVAGGANFPGKMPWEGGSKVWHSNVYAFAATNGVWREVGALPKAIGYGVSLTTTQGVLCIGGSDAVQHYADAFLLWLHDGKVSIRWLPKLPVPLAHGAGALVGKVAYVACGSEQPGEQAALNRCFGLDLSRPEGGWREMPPLPAEPRILPTAGATEGWFYLASGAALHSTNGAAKRVYLTDAWRFRPDKGWEQLPDLPHPRVAAATPAPVINSQLILFGGDDGSRVGFQPLSAHPGFGRTTLGLDLVTRQWREVGATPAPRATLTAVEWNGWIIFPSGESRPGVRSPEVWKLRAGPTR